MSSIIIIGGPTASGKSALALSIAQEKDAVIINADALQIYSAVPILTAQPSAADKAQVPHRLYGVLEADQQCSVGRWLGLAREAIDATLTKGRTPIIVGGTGLYLKSLIKGIPAIPAIDETVRQEARLLHSSMGGVAFHQLLTVRDPVMAARLHPSDSQRLMRAYEVIVQTGRSLAMWQQDPVERFYDARQFQCQLLLPPRERLYDQCNKRFLLMLEQGALDEVKALAGFDASAPALKAIGVKELRAVLEEKITMEEAIIAAQTATRHYAKRQVTWFRHQTL